METWIVAVLLGLILFIVIKMILMRAKFFNHRFSWILTLIVVLVLIGGFLLAIAGKGVDLTTKEGIGAAFKLYVAWFGNTLDNTKTLTSNAIKMDWSGNSTSGNLPG